jgi:alkylated DNA nucleotide flippase Atl1
MAVLRTEKTRRLFRNFASDVWGGTQSSYGCSGTVIGLPDSARMTTRTLAGVVSLALRETA